MSLYKMSERKLEELKENFRKEISKTEIHPSEKEAIIEAFEKTLQEGFKVLPILLEECDPQEIGV